MLINISNPLFKRGVLKACTVRCSAEPAVHVLSRTLTAWNTCSTRGACTLSGTRVGRRPNDGGPACFTFQQEQTSTRSRTPTAGESVCFWAQGEGGEAFDVTPASTVQVEIMEWVTESSLESGTAPAAAAGDPAVQKLLKQLMEMGFSENGSKRAMVACSRCPLPPGTPNQLYQPGCFVRVGALTLSSGRTCSSAGDEPRHAGECIEWLMAHSKDADINDPLPGGERVSVDLPAPYSWKT